MQIGSGASNHNNTNNTSIVILSTSRQDNGISLGMTGLLRIIGSSIAPALAAMFMQGYQYTVSKNIKPQILSWLGVISKPYHFGGVEFSLNKKDMGHIHGEKLADLPFPIEICKDLIDSRRALPHIIYPESMWLSYFIQNAEDAPKVVDLFRLQYDGLTKSKDSQSKS